MAEMLQITLQAAPKYGWRCASVGPRAQGLQYQLYRLKSVIKKHSESNGTLFLVICLLEPEIFKVKEWFQVKVPIPVASGPFFKTSMYIYIYILFYYFYFFLIFIPNP